MGIYAEFYLRHWPAQYYSLKQAASKQPGAGEALGLKAGSKQQRCKNTLGQRAGGGWVQGEGWGATETREPSAARFRIRDELTFQGVKYMGQKSTKVYGQD